MYFLIFLFTNSTIFNDYIIYIQYFKSCFFFGLKWGVFCVVLLTNWVDFSIALCTLISVVSTSTDTVINNDKPQLLFISRYAYQWVKKIPYRIVKLYIYSYIFNTIYGIYTIMFEYNTFLSDKSSYNNYNMIMPAKWWVREIRLSKLGFSIFVLYFSL